MPTPDLARADAVRGQPSPGSLTVILGALGWRGRAVERRALRTELARRWTTCLIADGAQQRRAGGRRRGAGGHHSLRRRPQAGGGAVRAAPSSARRWRRAGPDIGPWSAASNRPGTRRSVYLDDDRVADAHGAALAPEGDPTQGATGEPHGRRRRRAERRRVGRRSGNPGLLGDRSSRRYIQFVEAVDDVVREAKDVIRPMFATAPLPSVKPRRGCRRGRNRAPDRACNRRATTRRSAVLPRASRGHAVRRRPDFRAGPLAVLLPAAAHRTSPPPRITEVDPGSGPPEVRPGSKPEMACDPARKSFAPARVWAAVRSPVRQRRPGRASASPFPRRTGRSSRPAPPTGTPTTPRSSPSTPRRRPTTRPRGRQGGRPGRGAAWSPWSGRRAHGGPDARLHHHQDRAGLAAAAGAAEVERADEVFTGRLPDGAARGFHLLWRRRCRPLPSSTGPSSAPSGARARAR